MPPPTREQAIRLNEAGHCVPCHNSNARDLPGQDCCCRSGRMERIDRMEPMYDGRGTFLRWEAPPERVPIGVAAGMEGVPDGTPIFAQPTPPPAAARFFANIGGAVDVNGVPIFAEIPRSMRPTPPIVPIPPSVDITWLKWDVEGDRLEREQSEAAARYWLAR